MRRVVVTGVGAVTSLAHNAKDTWKAVLAGQSGIRSYQNDPVLKNPGRAYNLGLVSGFDFQKWKHAGSRMNSFLHCACEEALRDSGLELNEAVKMNMGVNIGSMSSSMSRLTECISQAAVSGFERINRLTMLHILSNIPTATLSIKYGLKGPSGSMSTACATGLSSVGDAYKWIKYGQADSAIVGGVQDVYNPTCLHSSIKLQAMTTKVYPTPSQSSRPFDEDRSGFVLGEGAGVLILQELESALKRKANIYAEVLGYSCTSDGYHLTRPEGNGQGILRAMRKLLQQSSIKIQQIDHVNCHATSTPVGDEAQAKAILQLLGSHSKNVTLSAFKANLGHTFGAAGAIELILSLLSMRDRTVPKILNLQKPVVSGLRLPQQNVPIQGKYTIKNALGFGGINVSMLFGKPPAF